MTKYGITLTGQLTQKSIYTNPTTGVENYQISVFDGFNVRRVSGVPKHIWDTMIEREDVSVNLKIFANYSQNKQTPYVSFVYSE